MSQAHRARCGARCGILASVDLNDAAQEVLSLLLSELQRDRVSLRTAFQEGLPPALGDRAQLQQVVLNLLLNALEAMSDVDDRPRLLVVGTETLEGGQLRLSVKDAGLGQDRETADRLFEPFFTTKQNGLRMGLFVSRSIIERHRGSLTAAPNEGPGATFSFSIPCSRGRA